MTKQYQFSVESTLPASVDSVWSYVTTPTGFLNELGPYFRMTVPTGFAVSEIDGLSSGDFVGTSRAYLWKVIPIERSRITVVDIAPPRYIRELHQMILFSEWWQERRLEEVESGTRVVDNISFSLRSEAAWVPGLTPLASRFWRHHIHARHLRLQAHYASVPTEKSV